MLSLFPLTNPNPNLDERDLERLLPVPSEPSTLFSKDFLHLADFLLDFSAHLFVLAFGFQIGIVRQFSCLLLNLTLHFLNLARYLILSAWLHFVASFERI